MSALKPNVIFVLGAPGSGKGERFSIRLIFINSSILLIAITNSILNLISLKARNHRIFVE